MGELGFWSEKTSQQELGLLSSMGDGGVTLAPSQYLTESVFSVKKQQPLMMRKGGEANGVDKGRNLEEKTPKKKKVDLEKNSELELGEFIPERNVEKGEFLSEGKWRKGGRKWELERGEVVLEKSRKGSLEKGELGSDRWGRCEVEKRGEKKGEKWERDGGDGDKWVGRLDFGSDRGRKFELERGEFVSENGSYRRKDGNSGENDSRKRAVSSWELKKSSSRSYDEMPGEFRCESGNGKGTVKDHAESWPKRHCVEPEISSRKCHQELSDNSRSKSQRKLEDFPERSYGNTPILSSRVSSASSNRYPSASRHYEQALQSRVSHEKQTHRDYRDHTPTHSNQSPMERGRHYDKRDHSPSYSNRSPIERARHYEQKDRSPMERSPKERSRHYEERDMSPMERSPIERARHYEQRDRSPMERSRHDQRELTPIHLDRSPLERVRHHDYRERSPHDRGRGNDYREKSRKSRSGEKQQTSSRHEERPGRRQFGGKDALQLYNNSSSASFGRSGSVDKSKRKDVGDSVKESTELPPPPPPPLPPPPPPPDLPPPPSPPPEQESTVVDEITSMEEDMDICDTPPHDTIPADMKPGKWVYLDYFGIEQGPSNLDDLKRLMEEGFLPVDHFIKHMESDRWVTVEHAASPLVQLNLSSVVSDAVTEMVSPPEASGNSLDGAGDANLDSTFFLLKKNSGGAEELVAVESVDDFHIDERVEALLDGYNVTDGKEIETIEEVLNVTFEHTDWESWGHSEGFTKLKSCNLEPTGHSIEEGASKEATEIRPAASLEEYPIIESGCSDWFSSRWSCMGGDWKRSDESANDRSCKKKIALNYGYPLCQMPKSGDEDPRLHRKDDLYRPSHIRRLELPPWAFTLSEDNNDSSTNDMSKSTVPKQMRTPIPRGVKGTILSVVRINSCVVTGQGSSESHVQVRVSERHSHRHTRSNSDRSSSYEGSSHSNRPSEHELQSLHEARSALNIPRDHVCTVDELSLNLGGWYYMDGLGHEIGPFSYSELLILAAKGKILQNSSVFRKLDNSWLPLAFENVHSEKETVASDGLSTNDTKHMGNASRSFHALHPQFIGYMRGKLHELAMKSYKNREFAAAINEVLDPWISAKLAKKEGDKHFPFNSSITKDLSAHKFWRSDDGDNYRYGKRVRLQFGEGDEDVEMEEDLLIDQKNDPSFDELCGGSVFIDEIGTSSEKDNGGWGLLDGHILARVFHFIRSDMRSLISTAATCKHWNMAAKFYKKLCLQVNLSSAGPICTDPMLRSIMGGYEKKRLTSLILAGCSNISPCALEEVLQQFPSISLVDIRGCNQFKDIIPKLQNVSWVKSYLANNRNYDESHSKLKSLKQISDKGSVARFKGLGGYPDETGDFGIDEFNVDRKDSSSQPFRQGFYKRAKLSDAKKSRDAQMRHLLHRKSVNGYKKLEAFIAINLKDIMRENKFDFFIPKVTQIEDRMRNGYYIRRGLGSVKNDISRMCRDAFKSNNRGDTKELKHIIMLFIRLAKSLDGNPGSKNERDDMMRKDGPETGFYSADRYRKKQNKAFEKKGTSRLNSSSYVNGGTDAFDREIKRGLSKLKKRDLGSDSESETSDDHENGFSGGETTASDTESDLDVHSGGGMGDFKGNMYSIVDDSLDSATDDREWGARMTKAGLVPPVTRKYEVIEEYLVIADEEEVKRKMQVALPDDYSEKLLAQKSGMEESEMEIPEVKDYKPRKMPGVEVLEQEVYGIDPYTHNLLLDSMPEEPEWLLVDKHKFIEEVLLRTLNKQVRRFTGARNTPMVYPLRHVVEEIHRNAEEDGDRRIVKLCQTMLKAMQSRRDDNYVAYRKGLGVVCNKEGGFSMDDFVVEFLGEVYPAWKWFEKQDGIRSLQKNSQEPAPEFYNIYLERPKGDRDGYDLVVVDAMHKANYASRICHSCRPNCEAKVTAVDGQYQIGIYTVRPIGYGEEITFDYNSVTESKEEYEASVCLCGSQICRGSYLNLTGEDAFHKVLKEYHGMLDRHKLMLEACEANFVSEEDYIDLGKAGLGKCLLSGLPDWLIAYAVRLVRFINFERTKLPDAILKHNVEEKKKFFADISYEDEKSDAEIQAEGVYNSRLQNLALTLDKVRYVMRRVFGDPKNAPPPLEKLSFEDLVSVLWKGEGSLVEELLQSMAHNMEEDLLNDLKSKILTHDPSNCDNLQRELQKSLLWLRDEVRNLPCSSKSRHDAAADLIHMYAYTKCFYKVRAYEAVTSPPVYISPLDLGPKYVEEMGSGFKEYCKTYGENYCLGQLIYWHSQNNADPDCRLDKVRRGCLSLPDIASFYGKSNKPVQEQVYDSRTVRFMMSRMEKQPQRPWPKDRIWVFKDNQKFFGSPMFDAVLNTCSLDKEMMHWLKSRPTVYQSLWES